MIIVKMYVQRELSYIYIKNVHYLILHILCTVVNDYFPYSRIQIVVIICYILYVVNHN